MRDWKQDALDLANTGEYSWREIAKGLGIAKSTVSDFLRNNLTRKPKAEKKKGPRVLFLDIETKYMVMQGWALYNQNFSLDQIQEDWHILSFSAKWRKEEEVLYYDVAEYVEEDLLAKMHDLLEEADFVVAHNGRRFDMKKIRARMITHGFQPHSPVRIIDTLEIAKKEFGFTSNKLQYLTNLLCKKNKKSSHAQFAGFLLWKEFVKGNPAAIQEMRDYNIIDVTSLEELYEILAPWSSTLPVFEVYDDEVADMSGWVADGFIYSNLGKYERFRNIETGQYRRGRVNMLSKEKRRSLLANIV